MGDLSYRGEEKIETPEDVRQRERGERQKQAEYDLRQGMKRGVGLPQPKIDSVVHIIQSDAEREEERRAAHEEQSAHDFADGTRLNFRRIGWA